MALRQAVSATLSSVTFRAAAKANRLVSRVLGMGRGPTAWEQLPALLEDFSERSQKSSAPTLADTPLRHAEASCSAAGLTDLSAQPEAATLLVLGALPPFALFVPYTHSQDPQQADLPERCWAVLAVPDPGDADDQLLWSAETIARSFDCPLAVWCETETAIPSTALAVGPIQHANSDLAGASDVLGFHRLLGQIRARGLSSGDVPFTETAYLRSNPDVAEAVESGDFASAEDHWNLIGRHEFATGSRRCQLRRDEPSLGLRAADPALRAQAQREWEGWDQPPKISVLVPVYKVELKWLRECVESVFEQIYPHWQLCIVDDGSCDPSITRYLGGLDDPRVSVRLLEENVGISMASNAALALAEAEHVALLDHDDVLTVDALWLVARVIHEHNPDIIYSDEAKLDEQNQVVEPHFKADFSWPMLLSQNYISHLGVYRASLVNAVDGFREGYEGSQDHDLLLRVAARAERIFHITRVLYYWRRVAGSTAARFSDKDYAWDRGVSAIQDAAGDDGKAEKGPYPGTYRVRRALTGAPTVSILVPFRDQPELLEVCLKSLLDKTDYRHFEVVGINNQSQRESTQVLMKQWADHPQVRFVDYDQPFNFSGINNYAAKLSEADHLLLLNNDIEALEGGWLEEMLSHSVNPGVGAVGALLLYPDETIQHAGVILGIGGVAGHSHKYLPEAHHGYFCRPHLTQNVSAVTGACLMVKRELYLRAGGLDEQNLTVAFNDIDFCLRLLEMGYENVYTPYARLIHHESKSRGAEDTPEKQKRFNREASFMLERHSLTLCLGDRWYNPNLSQVTEDFSLRDDVSLGMN